MLGSALPASAFSHAVSPPPSSTPSPGRPSRLRGLSYLRNHGHRDNNALVRTVTSPAEVGSSPTTTQTDEALNPASLPVRTDEGGWAPTVQGRSVMPRARAASSVETTSHASSTPTPPVPSTRRTREGTGTSATEANSSSIVESSSRDTLPTIRFIPHVELRASRPSLQFSAVSRTLKQANNIVRVGRYSERDNVTSSDASVAPIGFKSKVVSRRHCEFWCTNGQWFIKDVKSSSGTFLNHVRLSSPNAESRPYPVNDGDVVQLGIDFKGGEEVIFRCVKIRVECNRGWQKSLNSFNTSAHRRLLKNAVRPKNRDSDGASTHSSECSICLNPVAPCQALFVAPCSHVWHYKCVRNLFEGPNYPNFLCPNCRYAADLEADVEQPEFEELSPGGSSEDEESSSRRETPDENADAIEQEDGNGDSGRDIDKNDDDDETDAQLAGIMHTTSLLSPEDSASSSQHTPSHPPASATSTLPVTITSVRRDRPSSPSDHLAAGVVLDGPMTPRNDVGPFVFDGGASTGAAGLAAHALQEVTASEATRSSEHLT